MPVSNVNRYVSGDARVPAEFCGALVTSLGVNPAWLLTGEGATFLADVNSGTAALAGDMLELVEALNAVSRMRLGSLTGKHHLRVLRELNEALTLYESLRKRLNERSGPILTQLITDLNQAISSSKLDVAGDLRKAAAQIAQFSHDPELHRALRAAEGSLEFGLGNNAAALEISRDVFSRTLTRTDKPHVNTLVQAHNLAAGLCGNYRYLEARRVCRMALALAGDDFRHLDAWTELKVLQAVAAMELGDIEEGVGDFLTAWPQTSKHYRAAATSIVLRAMMLAGAIDWRQAAEWPGATIGRSRHMVRFAAFSNDAALMQQAQQRYIGDGPDMVRPDVLEGAHLAALLARGRKRAAALGALRAAQTGRVPAAVADVMRSVCIAHAALTAGDRGLAARTTTEAEGKRQALGPEVSLDFLYTALHYRNAVASLDDGELRARAQTFLQSRRQAGYGILAA